MFPIMGRTASTSCRMLRWGLGVCMALAHPQVSCSRRSNLPAPGSPAGQPTRPIDFTGVDRAVERAIQEGHLPGAVVLIGNSREVLHHKAFGWRQLEPAPVLMTADTAFDLASLTKPVATATSILLLSEQGRVQLSDPVAKFLPAFAANGKADVTIEQLLIHASGLTADNSLEDYQSGVESALAAIDDLALEHPPGQEFSDTC